ncbi:MAG: hypothetical protein AAFX50_10485 [Acidobacteriota bacterium]
MDREPMDRFDDALKAWARTPPRRAPGDAAREVLGRLPDGRRRSPSPRRRARSSAWAWANVAAAAALVAIMGLRFAPAPYLMPEPPGPSLEAPPLPEDVILMWLDSETPLYLSVPSAAAPGSPTPHSDQPTPRPAEGAPTP